MNIDLSVEYCFVTDSISCARTDAIFVPRMDSKSHVKGSELYGNVQQPAVRRSVALEGFVGRFDRIAVS